MNQLNNQPGYNYDYDEIDLRDIFRTLGKWKYTIISVTLICMFLSGIVSLFFIDPVYEATAMVAPASASTLANQNNISYLVTGDDFDRITDSKKISDSLDSIIKLTQVDVSRYTALMTSNHILWRTIKELDLKTTPAKLKEQIRVETNKDDGVSQVTVSHTDPAMAAQIANTLINQTAAYLKDLNDQKMNQLLKNLQTQQAAAQVKAGDAFTRLKEFEAGSTSANAIEREIEIRKLQNEVDRREDILNSLNSKIFEMKVIQSFNSVEDMIVMLSAATVPQNPVKPNKKLNVAIAGVLGLMVAVFGVFLVEYLKNDDEQEA
jgi:capsular polysaccharide biosynthesis protein